jgi:peroxiredoxin
MGELGEFAKHDAEFEALDVQIVAISVDPAEKGKWVEDKLKAPFPILSDSKREVMELYGTQSPEYHNHQGGSINTPTLVLIDKTGTIRWVHQATSFRVRAAVQEDLTEARKLK